MPSAGFEPATKRPQTYALDRAATEVGQIQYYEINNSEIKYLLLYCIVFTVKKIFGTIIRDGL
jgi:hypothetical protein